MKMFTRTVLGGALALAPLSVVACAACGCTLSGDWDSQGFSSQPGVRMELRHDFLNQSQLRSGTSKVDRSAITLPADREIEQGTINRYTTLGIDYNPNANWGINLQLPFTNRSHTTIAPGDTDISSSHTSSIGDVRVLARYQGLTAARNIGIQFGLKLPTGDYRANFDGGPQDGQPLDRGLQPGSGTTDLLLGGFLTGTITDNMDYYLQALVQAPLNARDGYKPGVSLNANVGIRYLANDNITPELQINARTITRDSGINSDRENSGGTLVYLTPGATVAVTHKLKLFGFVQLPVYQRVNGYQLTPRYTASVGARYEF